MPTLSELALITFIMVVVFGANRLPAVGDALGRLVRNRLHGRASRRRVGNPDP
jgi:Sec-independent protein translocase protein TatA